jgi:group I intron endonuclease
MIIAKKYFDIISNLFFFLDNVMFWEAFRWERLDMGHIYIQKFSNGKMYAGQTINLTKRMNTYKNLKGSNKHHTRALKKHIYTMQIAFTQCPNYLLDAVEIFLIALFDLTDPTKGYNKQTGGHKGYRHSKDVRMQISESQKGDKNHMFGKRGVLNPNYGRKHKEEVCANISKSKKGKNHPNFGKTLPVETRAKISEKNSGENHPNFGKTAPEETCIRMSESKKGEKNYWFGKTFPDEMRAKMSESKKGENHPNFGKTLPEETRVKISTAQVGGKNHNSKPLCVFGKLYASASTASNILREVCDTAREDNFMVSWVKRKKHQHNIFYVSREFFTIMKDTDLCITRDLYEQWVVSFQ